MNFSLPLSLFFFIGAVVGATTFTVVNNCRFPIWPVNFPTSGGSCIGRNHNLTFNVPAGTSGRLWGRVGCSPAGGCNGSLPCLLPGRLPATLAEYTLNGYRNLDYLDLSLMGGFNLPMEFAVNSGACSQSRQCATGDLIGQCPKELRVSGGCVYRADYADFFKKKCPEAYSRPGDDQIFICPAGANYRVVFCH